MMIEITLEGLSKNVEEATLQNWFFEEGDRVNEGDEIAQLSSGDGTIVIQAKSSGIVAEVYYDEGDTVPKGEVLCLIDNEEDEDRLSSTDDEDEDDDKDEEDEEDEVDEEDETEE